MVILITGWTTAFWMRDWGSKMKGMLRLISNLVLRLDANISFTADTLQPMSFVLTNEKGESIPTSLEGHRSLCCTLL